MAEICFEAFAWKMPQWNKRLPLPAMVLEEVALHLSVAALITMFVAEATNACAAVCRCLGGAVRSSATIWSRMLWKGPSFGANRFRGVEMGSGFLSTFLIVIRDRLNSRAICRMDLPPPTRPPNSAVIVHREHFRSLRASECVRAGATTLTKTAGWVTFRRSHCP